MEEILKINSQAELFQKLGSEDACVEYLIQLKWGGKPSCSNCSSKERVYYIKSRQLFKCSECNKHMSIRKNTLFQNSKLPLRIWFLAIYNLSTETINNGYSACKAQRDLGVSYKTAWTMLHKIRETMKFENEGKINGIVEADEVYCGARLNRDNKLRYRVYEAQKQRIRWGLETKEEYKSRKKKEAKWNEKFPDYKVEKVENELDERLKGLSEYRKRVAKSVDFRESEYKKVHYRKNIVGFLQVDETEEVKNKKGKIIKKITKYGKIRLAKVGREKKDICKPTITPLLEKFLTRSTILMTDGTDIYDEASNIVKKHFKVQHTKKKNEKHKPIKYAYELKNNFGIECFTTNRIENAWNHFKKMENGTYIHFSWEHTDRYLYEFVFKYNNRGLSIAETFDKIIGATMDTVVSYKALMNSKSQYSYRS